MKMKDNINNPRAPNSISRAEYMMHDLMFVNPNQHHSTNTSLTKRYADVLSIANKRGYEFVSEALHQLHQVYQYTVQELAELFGYGVPEYSEIKLRIILVKLNIFVQHEFNYQTLMYRASINYQIKNNIKPIIDDPGDFIAFLYQKKPAPGQRYLSLRQIAEIFDCTYPTIKKTLLKRNVKLRKRGGPNLQKLSSKQIDLIIFNYNLKDNDPEKMLPRHLSRKLGVSETQIYYWINKFKNKKRINKKNGKHKIAK